MLFLLFFLLWEFFFLFSQVYIPDKMKIILLICSMSWMGISKTDRGIENQFWKVYRFKYVDFPYSVSFLLFQALSVFSNSRILFPKFSFSASAWLYEKNTPKASIGSFGHLKSKGVSWLFFRCPNHKASVFVVLISNPERALKLSINLSSLVVDSRSRTKTVVSSAYCTTFNSLLFTWLPLIESFRFKVLAKSSILSINKIPDKGQPWRTPRCKAKKLEAWPLFTTQLETSLKTMLIQFMKLGSKLTRLRAALR